MPKLVYDQLDVGRLEPTNWSCKGFDRTRQTHAGQVVMLVSLARKTIFVNVAVLSQDLDYNMLLGHPWIDEMEAIILALFGEIQFFHQGEV